MQFIANSPSPSAALMTTQRIGYVLMLLTLLCCSSRQSYGADTLECPEIGATSVPNIMGDASGGGLFVTENRVDLANEINETINSLQIANPNISWSDLQDVLVAAYCRVVARKGELTAAEKMGPYATVPTRFGTADRSEHDASGHADHRQRSSSPRRFSRTQEAGFCLQSNAGPTDDSHPDACSREVADGWTIASARLIRPGTSTSRCRRSRCIARRWS
jgi:hypothetical protein